MTKKDFKELTWALYVVRPDKKGATLAQWQADVEAVAGVCTASNSQFDYNKFLEACGAKVGDKCP